MRSLRPALLSERRDRARASWAWRVRSARAPLLFAFVVLACDFLNEPTPPPLPPTFTVSPTGPVTLLVGQTFTLTANVAHTGGYSVSYSSAATSVATVDQTGLVQAVGEGSTDIRVALFAEGGYQDVRFVRVEVVPPGAGVLTPRVSVLGVINQPEALTILSGSSRAAFAGGGGFADFPAGYVAVIAGSNGYAAVDLASGDVLRHQTFSGTAPLFGVAAASVSPPGAGSPAVLFGFGSGGWALHPFDGAQFQSPVTGPSGGPVYDAQPAGGQVASRVLSFVRPQQGVGFVEYEATNAAYTATAELLPAGQFAGELVSAFVPHDGTGSGRAPALVLTRAVQSRLYRHARDGSAPSAGLNVGLDARKLRCVSTAGTAWLCAVSVFGNDGLAIVRWDGAAPPVGVGNVPVGDGPVGIDLRVLPGGNVAVLSTGFADHTITETELSADGAVVSNETRAAPDGCQSPGHAVYVADTVGLKIVGTCYGSGSYFIGASRF